MKAYIQTNPQGDYYNVNAFIAAEGFNSLGWETEKYVLADEIPDLNPEHIVVGGIANVRKRLENLGMKHSATELDYPQELAKYLGRKVWPSTVGAVVSDESSWNIFIKPRQETKKFTGKLVRSYTDFIGLDNETEIWCSEAVDFVTEWRCFIRYGEILDIRRYKGAWDTKPDLSVIRNAVADFKSAPRAYGLDFGIDQNGTMKLVEVNDGHSLGSYGMGAVDYAKFLSARWSEMAGVEDYLRF